MSCSGRHEEAGTGTTGVGDMQGGRQRVDVGKVIGKVPIVIRDICSPWWAMQKAGIIAQRFWPKARACFVVDVSLLLICC